MSSGTIIAIYTTPTHSQPTQPRESVHVVPGLGLEGDRYFGPPGTPGKRIGTGRDITLIEIEALQAFEGDQHLRLEPADARRNIVTRGVSLNDLVGLEFQVGPVSLRGVRLCEPCEHLASLTDARVLPGLVSRGGLRAEILTGGIISVGDPITIPTPEQS
jgi:MOSC domain-containing protein YiiM